MIEIIKNFYTTSNIKTLVHGTIKTSYNQKINVQTSTVPNTSPIPTWYDITQNIKSIGTTMQKMTHKWQNTHNSKC